MNKPISAERLEEALAGEFKALCAQVAEAINSAHAGHIIAESEEPVRDAVAVFRQQLYQMAVDIRQKSEEGAFSPSASSQQPAATQQGAPEGNSCDGKRRALDQAPGVLGPKRKRGAGR